MNARAEKSVVQPAFEHAVAGNGKTRLRQALPDGWRTAADIAAFKGSVTVVIDAMRHGVSAAIVPGVAQRFGLSQDKLFEILRLPKSTMKARIGSNALLSPVEQDRIYRADRVWDRAVAVLEDEDAARCWVTRENRSLGGVTPLSLLDTEAGYELVLDTLGRIAHGVIA
ncbi:MAG: DUF2384 domain-containing protein [Methylococcaceae bacterium]|nr:MAG: DUF2384 domain-containing protein [Methylococcaceae bacterium]